MASSPSSKEFKRLRNSLKLSVQDVALEMSNTISFNTIYNFEHGMPPSEETKKQIQKWIDSKKNLIINKP
jgi:transcriptional regulator with XRE-family HTH domain